jgi:hypothetical protein
MQLDDRISREDKFDRSMSGVREDLPVAKLNGAEVAIVTGGAPGRRGVQPRRESAAQALPPRTALRETEGAGGAAKRIARCRHKAAYARHDVRDSPRGPVAAAWPSSGA